MSEEPVRVTAARRRVADAEQAYADARHRADAARRERAPRRTFRLRIAVIAAVTIAVALIATSVVLVVVDRNQRSDTARAGAALAAARSAITTVLTADPAQPKQYVDAVLAVSTGDFRRRVTRAVQEIESSIATQPLPSTGQVVSAGIVGRDPGASADVLLVAEATNPQLLGGGTGDSRIVLAVRMTRVDGTWKIAQAELQ